MTRAYDLLCELRSRGAAIAFKPDGRAVIRGVADLPGEFLARVRERRGEVLCLAGLERSLGADVTRLMAEIVEERDELDEAGILPAALLPGTPLVAVLEVHLRQHGAASLERLVTALHAASVALDTDEMARLEGSALSPGRPRVHGSHLGGSKPLGRQPLTSPIRPWSRTC